MVPLLACAAVAIDVAGLYASKAQLQNGADAAALGVAQNCAHRACGSPQSTASSLAAANTLNGVASVSVSPGSVNPSTGTVTVTASATRSNLFAGLIGRPKTTVNASATAVWGGPSGGTSPLPLTFSWCEWKAQTLGGYPSATVAVTILLSKNTLSLCLNAAANLVPGGFGWLTANAGCQVSTSIASYVSSSPGNTPPASCNANLFAAQQGKTVLLPIFDSSSGSGNNATYHIYGYAAFVITGYYFAGQYSWNQPCSGSDRCIRGYFTGMVSLDTSFTYGATAPDMGASVVRLTK